MDQKLKQAQEKLSHFWRQNHRLPSFAELCTLFGYASKNAAAKLVNKLKEAQIIEQDDNGRLIPGKLLTGLPVLGYVQAGFPTPAEEELADTITLDQYLLRNPNSCFITEVAGDSMLGAGIQPKDLVIIDRGLTPQNNDIVLAQIDSQWTLKYFQKKNKSIYLQAANEKYPKLIPQQELVIAGVVVSCVRKYK
ncbi:MAG: hypothetical protein COX77_02190 [Candidatus Komeilibacteria bacterium CG_4_10_14_0_2_um_filter_37_10]|uniref:Peptidase S24/S26A/S26B/S26C domain-containing protein n=1 Tax=Candidatus Komeilibacteria bacterium CG_4_10_14_0_2_um_filter_37_10 TaxID=1974470 RepID=A0A2M7VF56_9BACT|nr:MAG: hypothetical protein COX77_02190 [Candidatus Komeilibacteria bacterium CG_4_10_14_0_2_um_filter_37_10]PJA92586.1 MAG: hypothetical protein CO133_02385 [Candidatus Komeilibacteria bacterium CG_4_9_14_3_um_filter_37_5]